MLASGSSGNCALIATEKTRVLVDAGLSFKELTKRLASIGEQPGWIDAVLITHEHSDHISGLARFARRVPAAPIFMTRLTAPAIEWDGALPAIQPFQAGAPCSRAATAWIEPLCSPEMRLPSARTRACHRCV